MVSKKSGVPDDPFRGHLPLGLGSMDSKPNVENIESVSFLHQE